MAVEQCLTPSAMELGTRRRVPGTGRPGTVPGPPSVDEPSTRVRFFQTGSTEVFDPVCLGTGYPGAVPVGYPELLARDGSGFTLRRLAGYPGPIFTDGVKHYGRGRCCVAELNRSVDSHMPLVHRHRRRLSYSQLNFMEQQEPKTAEEFHIKSQARLLLLFPGVGEQSCVYCVEAPCYFGMDGREA